MSYTWDYLLTDNASPMYRGIAEHVMATNAKRVLDLGCGHTRWLEFYAGTAKVVGIDNNEEAIMYCNNTYPAHEFLIGDAWDLKHEGTYDTIVLGGILYYFKHDVTVLQFVESLIERYKPKQIVIQEPFPSLAHKSPDFIPLLDKYAWYGEWYDLDIRMGQRIVITVDVDRVRPERKIKQDSNNNQNPFDINILQYGVYTANTEAINHPIDGEVFPPNPTITSYASVCAGFKSLYKACLDHTEGKQIEFTWYDISPTAVLYKMYQDMMRNRYPGISWDDQVTIYKNDYDSRLLELRDPTTPIDSIVDAQLKELGIPQHKWDAWLLEYSKSKRTYVKCDIVNNLKYARKHLPHNSWLWYSNVFDWHQFTFPEKAKAAWVNYMGKHNTTLIGKTILSPVETLMSDYIAKSTSAESYNNILVEVVNRLWYGINTTTMTNEKTFTVKENDYAQTIINNEYKLKLYIGYNAVLAKNNYERCKHLLEGKSRAFEYKGIRIEIYEYIPGTTLDNVKEDITEPVRALVNNICNKSTTPVYPYDISPYNLIYTPDKRVVIIDWDYMICGTQQELEEKIETALGIKL